MTYFYRGDIVHLELDPAAGKEMVGEHYALIVSPNDFHKMGLAIICPISRGEAAVARNAGYLVSLMPWPLKVDGNIHTQHVKSVDLKARNAKKYDVAPADLVEEVLDKLNGLFL